jgi:hypothetical protein
MPSRAKFTDVGGIISGDISYKTDKPLMFPKLSKPNLDIGKRTPISTQNIKIKLRKTKSTPKKRMGAPIIL